MDVFGDHVATDLILVLDVLPNILDDFMVVIVTHDVGYQQIRLPVPVLDFEDPFLPLLVELLQDVPQELLLFFFEDQDGKVRIVVEHILQI